MFPTLKSVMLSLSLLGLATPALAAPARTRARGPVAVRERAVPPRADRHLDRLEAEERRALDRHDARLDARERERLDAQLRRQGIRGRRAAAERARLEDKQRVRHARNLAHLERKQAIRRAEEEAATIRPWAPRANDSTRSSSGQGRRGRRSR